MSTLDTRVTISVEDLEAIIRRAGALGIPAWRVSAALGIALTVDHPAPHAGASGPG